MTTEKERADAFFETVMAGAEAAHAEDWPEGCPGPCGACDRRLAQRCADSHGHVWRPDFDYGDTCYCGGQFMVKHPNARIEVYDAPAPERTSARREKDDD